MDYCKMNEFWRYYSEINSRDEEIRRLNALTRVRDKQIEILKMGKEEDKMCCLCRAFWFGISAGLIIGMVFAYFSILKT